MAVKDLRHNISLYIILLPECPAQEHVRWDRQGVL